MQTIYEFSPIVCADKDRAVDLAGKLQAANNKLNDAWALKGVATDAAARAAQYAAGHTPAPRQSAAALIENAKAEVADLKLAGELHAKQAAERLASETVRYLKSLRSGFEKDAADFAESFRAAHAALVKLDNLKAHCLSNGVGFYPIVLDFAPEAEAVFGWSRDKSGAVGNLFRALVKGGHLKELPKEMK